MNDYGYGGKTHEEEAQATAEALSVAMVFSACVLLVIAAILLWVFL